MKLYECDFSKGKKYRRSTWADNCYVFRDRNRLIDESGREYHLRIDMITIINNWEEYVEPEKAKKMVKYYAYTDYDKLYFQSITGGIANKTKGLALKSDEKGVYIEVLTDV